MCIYGPEDYDRIWHNDDDGQIFYGYDDGEGNTDWYDVDGHLDSTTETPEDWEQEKEDEGY